MQKFFIITNEPKDPELAITQTAAEHLRARGASVVVRERNGSGASRHTAPEEVPEGTECVIVLGGDGTLMRAADDLVDLEIPLLGVNLGTLGYLAEIERSAILPAMDALLEDNYHIEERMMLQGCVKRNGETLCSHTALNDIIVSREGPPHVIVLRNYVNNKYLNEYRADGLIVSSPTGSTGYSLSAGGPIISPQAELFLLTPLAAHTLSARSVILPAENQIRIEIMPNKEENGLYAVATFDGENNVSMRPGDSVEISKAERSSRILKIRDDSFLEILSRKLN